MSEKSPYNPDCPWPSMRGDTRNTGCARDLDWTPEKSGSEKVTHFRTGNGVFSTPVIGRGDKVYVGSADRVFYAIDPVECRELWRRETNEIIDSAACLDKYGNVYFGAGDSNIHALDEEGAGLWRFDALKNRPEGLFSASTNYWWEANIVMGPDGALYAANDDFFVYCFETDGGMRWAFRTGLHIWAAPGFGADGTVYVPGFDMKIYALDPKTGKLKWKKDLGNALVSTPAIGEDGVIYQGSFDGKLYALNPSNGDVKWSVPTGGHIYASAALAPDGMLYVGSTDGLLYAIDSRNGSVKWTFFAGDAIRSSASIGPDPEKKAPYLVYFGGGDGSVYALDPDGKRRWSYDTLVDAPTREYSNINASAAMGKTGMAIASAGGDVIWIPYDYYLRDGAGGITTLPDDGFEKDGGAFYNVTAGGLIERTPVGRYEDEDDRRVLHPSQIVSLRLISRKDSETLPVKIERPTLSVKCDPPFLFKTTLQADGRTVHIIPEEIIKPGRNYKIELNASYKTNGASLSDARGVFAFETAKSKGRNIMLEDESPYYRITHMSIQQPAIVPSLDQIGIASLNIPFSVVRRDPENRSFVALGVQIFGLTETGEAVGVPQYRKLFYVFAGQTRDDFFMMDARNCMFEMTGFPIPLDRLRFAGQLNNDGTVAEGASLLAEYKTPELSKTLPRLLGGSYKTVFAAAKWVGGKVKEAGLKQFGEIMSVELPTAYSMLKNRYWRKWGLFNEEGEFTGVGTFRMGKIAKEKNAKRSSAWVSRFEYNSRRRRVEAEVVTRAASEDNFREKVIGIVLIDTRTGMPVPMDYNTAIRNKDVGDGTIKAFLDLPPSAKVKPGHFLAVLTSDLYVLEELEI